MIIILSNLIDYTQYQHNSTNTTLKMTLLIYLQHYDHLSYHHTIGQPCIISISLRSIIRWKETHNFVWFFITTWTSVTQSILLHNDVYQNNSSSRHSWSGKIRGVWIGNLYLMHLSWWVLFLFFLCRESVRKFRYI